MRPVTQSSRSARRWAGVGGAVALALLAAGCGGGDDTRTVTAVDYRFENLPESVDAGTTLKLENDSTRELHEMVIIRIPDSEQRPVDELVRLPESELEALFSGPPTAVLLRAPDGEQINAVGDGKLTEPGRYAVVCFIPTGADPAAYLAAAAEDTEGPPQVEGGPPHAAQGMYGEITVR